jgi:hypothetical protein
LNLADDLRYVSSMKVADPTIKVYNTFNFLLSHFFPEAHSSIIPLSLDTESKPTVDSSGPDSGEAFVPEKAYRANF